MPLTEDKAVCRDSGTDANLLKFFLFGNVLPVFMPVGRLEGLGLEILPKRAKDAPPTKAL